MTARCDTVDSMFRHLPSELKCTAVYCLVCRFETMCDVYVQRLGYYAENIEEMIYSEGE